MALFNLDKAIHCYIKNNITIFINIIILLSAKIKSFKLKNKP